MKQLGKTLLLWKQISRVWEMALTGIYTSSSVIARGLHREGCAQGKASFVCPKAGGQGNGEGYEKLEESRMSSTLYTRGGPIMVASEGSL